MDRQMLYQKTRAYEKLLTLTKRVRGVCGGTSASKTISILLWLIDYSQTHKNQIVSVVSESFPHLRKGAMRDFQNILQNHGYWIDSAWDKTNSTYTFPSNTKIEFFSADQPGKVRGPRRDILFINEANNIPYETYDQLEIRTKDLIWCDWNPVNEFWFYTDVMNRENVDFLTLTYLDNEGLDPQIVEAIESRKGNKSWWKVYGEGQLGEVESRIYKDWQIIDTIPKEARLERYGLDFGYTNDPTACVGVYKYNDSVILDEVIYRKGLLNSEIANKLKDLPEELIIADSAEPKSIDELCIYGLSVIPAIKGPGSINQGIQSVQSKKIMVTKGSVNLLKEYRNYLWMTDNDGKIINKPTGFDDHLLDAARYAIADLYPLEDEVIKPKDTRIPGTYVRATSEDEGNGDFYTDRSSEWGE